MTDAEPKYLVCPTPTWVGHTTDQNVPMTALEIMREVRAGRVVFEALGFGPVRVYADFEKGYATMEEMHASRDAELQRCIAELSKLNGRLTDIVVLDSCGYKKDSGPQLSWHFILPGKGSYDSPADLKRAGLIPFRKDEPKVWDQCVFPELGCQRLMRTLGANKPGENRPFLIIVNGKLTSLEELYSISEDVALVFFKKALIQNVEGETHFALETTEAPAVELKQRECGKVVALGGNGKVFGDDVIVTKEAIRELCGMAGWFLEFDRDRETWMYEMWMLQNIADDNKLGDGLDELMMEVSAVWKGGIEDVKSVMDIRRVSMNRPANKKRKNLGALRKLAGKKDPDGYVLWMDKHKKPIYSGLAKPDTMTFYDHNKFTGKVISHEMALKWAQDALVYVENGGTSYFLTREKKTCEVTNIDIEVWKHTSEDDMMRCLDTVVYITNEKRTPEAIAVVEQKEKLNAKCTPAERRAAAEFMYRSFGKGTKKETQFMGDVLTHRKFRVVREEDFIPFLARRIPDANIARKIADETLFNSFKQFPIEALPLNTECKYGGSRMQNHLREVICQGDEVEFKHLEGTIADIIQRPYEISGVAHVFYGGQGTGKSILGVFMRGLIGAAQVMEFNDVATYFSRFNDDHATALLKIFEELSDKGEGLINNNKLKADITKNEIRIEIKGAAIFNFVRKALVTA